MIYSKKTKEVNDVLVGRYTVDVGDQDGDQMRDHYPHKHPGEYRVSVISASNHLIPSGGR